MRHLLLTTIAAVLVVGCGQSQQSTPAPEAKPVEPVAEAAQPEPPKAKAPDIDIWTAAARGDIEAVKQHLAAGTDVNAMDSFRQTALHLAAQQGHEEVAELLIVNGADLEAKNKDGLTPLHVAALKGHKEIAELLIAEGADVNAKDKYGFTPLHQAAVKGRKEMAELLIAKGADVNAKIVSGATQGMTPLDAAVGQEVSTDYGNYTANETNHPETADLLRKHGGKTKKELEAEKTSAPNSELQNTLQNKKKDYDLQIKTLNGQIADKDRAIDDIGRRLESVEEDRDQLINERNKLIAEKAELEKQFQDILVLRRKVQQLQFELNQSLLRKHGGKTGEELKAEGK